MKHHCLLTGPDETASYKTSLERPTNSAFAILGVINRSVLIMIGIIYEISLPIFDVAACR
jgi:hypothetical protein